MITTVAEKQDISTFLSFTKYIPEKNLTDFIKDRNRKLLKDLRGKISFRDDYDYKLMRN